MRRLSILLTCFIPGFLALYSQSDPLSTEAKQAWTRTINNVIAAAEKMPDDGYAYKPTPESMSFRDLVAHVADSAMGSCSSVNGERKNAGAAQMQTKADLEDAILHGAVRRIRPKMMTVMAILMGLLPIMWSHGAGADVMKRIATPMVGGVITSFVLELLIYLVIFAVWKGWRLAHRHEGKPPAATVHSHAAPS